MRVLLKKDFTIDLLSVDKVINVNDVMVSRLEVEVEENFLLPGERLWVVFSKTKDNPTDDITKEIQLATDNKTYSVAIPQAVVMQEGTWYFILSARKYYSAEKYFTRMATAPYEFTVEGGLWIDEDTGEVVNNGTAQSLYEMATEKLAIEQDNAEDILALQEKDAAQDAAYEAFKQETTEAIGFANSQINRVETQATQDIADIRVVANRAEGMAYNAETGLGIVYNSSAGTIVASIDNSTFVMTIKLFDRNNNEMSSTQIDLPLESMVVDAEYNPAAGGAIVLKLQSGSIIPIPVADIVQGLISESEKGVPNGVATLDENGKVPTEQLPKGSGGVSEEEVKEAVKETLTNRTETWTDEEKAAACETIGAATKTEVELLSKALVQSGTIYTADIETEYNERVTADGENVLNGSQAVLKKVVGNTVACKNLVDIPFIDATTGSATQPIKIEVNINKDIFVSAGELAKVSASIRRFILNHADGTVDYIVDDDIASGGIKIAVTADNPIVSIEYIGTYITAGRYSKIMIEYGDTATEYQPYFTGLKSASFGGIESGGKNLVDIPFINSATYQQEFAVNFWQDIFVSVGELATVSSSIWRFQFVLKDGTSFYATDLELERGGKKISATADNPIVKIVYRGNYITAGQYSKIMIEYGTTATEYTPYISPYLYAFSKTEMPLGKTIDFENKKITDYGVEIVLTGAETFSYYGAKTTIGGNPIFYPSIFVQVLPNNENRVLNAVSTDGAVPKSEQAAWDSNVFWIGVNNKYLYWIDILRILGFTDSWVDEENPTNEEQNQAISDFKAYLAQRYADGNPVTIRYVSSTLQSETDFTADNEYTAYKGGTEKVLYNDGNEYGANNTLTQNYILVKE